MDGLGLPAIVVYDDGCRLCRVAMALVIVWDRRGRVWPVGFSRAASLGAPAGTDSWHLRDIDGRWYSGGAAAGRLMQHLRGGRPIGRVLLRMPAPTERVYRAVARRRGALGRVLPVRSVRWAEGVIERRLAGR